MFGKSGRFGIPFGSPHEDPVVDFLNFASWTSSGDAWNDLVDLLAKQERVKSIQDSPFVLPHFFWCPARWFDIS